MRKTIHILIALILFFTILAGLLYYDAVIVAPSRFGVNYKTVSSDTIPEQLDGINILFFSDVYYGEYMDENRFQKAINLINDASVDVVVFLGDLISDSVVLSGEENNSLQQLLQSINAPLGKFAVLGDTDLSSTTSKSTTETILTSSGFEMITNEVILLRNRGSQSISLIGLDSLLIGDYSTDVFSQLSPNSFAILAVHEPDMINQISTDRVNVQVSGHSLGGQVYFPIFSEFNSIEGATRYYRGSHTVDKTKLFITNGLGTTDKDIRFLANPEVLILTLNSTSSPAATPTTTSLPEEESTPTVEAGE